MLDLFIYITSFLFILFVMLLCIFSLCYGLFREKALRVFMWEKPCECFVSSQLQMLLPLVGKFGMEKLLKDSPGVSLCSKQHIQHWDDVQFSLIINSLHAPCMVFKTV